jgi:hypothetical protein
VIRFRANGIVRTFFRHNGEYLDGLRERLREQWSVAGTRLRSVGVPRLPEQGLRPVIEHFFAELNVAVVQVIDNAHDLITEGRTQAGRRRVEAQQALAGALERLRGRVDCVIVPIVHDNPENTEPVELTGSVSGLPESADLPRVLHVAANLSPGGLQEMLTKLGLLVTDDLERIRRAVEKTLETAQVAALQTADT